MRRLGGQLKEGYKRLTRDKMNTEALDMQQDMYVNGISMANIDFVHKQNYQSLHQNRVHFLLVEWAMAESPGSDFAHCNISQISKRRRYSSYINLKRLSKDMKKWFTSNGYKHWWKNQILYRIFNWFKYLLTNNQNELVTRQMILTNTSTVAVTDYLYNYVNELSKLFMLAVLTIYIIQDNEQDVNVQHSLSEFTSYTCVRWI